MIRNFIGTLAYRLGRWIMPKSIDWEKLSVYDIQSMFGDTIRFRSYRTLPEEGVVVKISTGGSSVYLDRRSADKLAIALVKSLIKYQETND